MAIGKTSLCPKAIYKDGYVSMTSIYSIANMRSAMVPVEYRKCALFLVLVGNAEKKKKRATTQIIFRKKRIAFC